MSNPAMEKPTEEQEKSLAKMLADMGQTVRSIENITDTIGDLRRELNNAAVLLGQLEETVGPQAYSYSKHRWQDLISQQIGDIQKVLK